MNNSKFTVGNITLYKVTNDVWGNPRYVIHYLDIDSDYEKAHKLAKQKLGGRKYTAKWFGGGFVFQSYSVENDLRNAGVI